MNPQDKTKALETPVIYIGFELWKAFILIVLLKLGDDNLYKYVVHHKKTKSIDITKPLTGQAITLNLDFCYCLFLCDLSTC